MLSTSEQVSGCLEEPCYPCGVVQRGPMPAPAPSPTPVPTPSQTTTTTPAPPPPMPTPVPPSPVPVSTYVCTDNQCVEDFGGIALELCQQICGSTVGEV